MNGWGNFINKKGESLFENDKQNRNISVVIADADSAEKDKCHGGWKNRYDFIKNKLQHSGFECKLFLWPNNHDDGDFECMLEKIVAEKHKCVLSCFDSFVKCIQNRTIDEVCMYNVPNNKNKMYTYITSMKGVDKEDWQFENMEYWNIHHEYLTKFKQFIEQLQSF